MKLQTEIMHAVKVSRSDYGDAWPFTVEEGWLRRCPRTDAVRFKVGNTNYALTGTARAFYKKDADVSEIHAEQPGLAPLEDGTRIRKPLTPIIRDGLRIGR